MKLTKKFKVLGIPMLVLVDGSSGDVINTHAHTHITEDPDGTAFPWRQVPIQQLMNAPLVKQSTVVAGIDALEDKITLLFFSAKWVSENRTKCYHCIPSYCVKYTPCTTTYIILKCVMMSTFSRYLYINIQV